MDEIKITLETLYDILRNEKKKEDLQKLEKTFFEDLVRYLDEKKKLLTQSQSQNELFAMGEKDKMEYEIRSIKRILKEIYEKREKKIIQIAMNKSRTGSDIIDTSAMLPEEKQFYQQLLGTLDFYRRGILLQLFNNKMPNVTVAETFNSPTSKVEQQQEEPEGPTTKIKFTHAMPSFVWKDMKTYGPYTVGQEVDIFPEVAELLVRKGRAEKI